MPSLTASPLAARRAFLKIDIDDLEAAKSVWPLIEQKLPEILEGFYAHVRTVPHLKELVEGREQELITAQAAHWKTLFTSGLSETYVEQARRIGLAHVRINLDPTWYVGAYSYVINRLMEVVAGKNRFSGRKMAQVMNVITKFIMLDMDMAISTYHDKMLEEAQEREQKIRDAVGEFDAALQATVSRLSGASGELDGAASNLERVTNEVQSRVEHMDDRCGEASQSVNVSADATEQMKAAISEISEQAQQSRMVAETAVQDAERTNASVTELANAAETVGSVIELISEIAAQTNLLALNATIEAARAGELGRGFAVVASEVKELASQTTKATEDITAQIANIQRATKQSATDIGSITETINKVAAISSAIASAVEEQTAATGEISYNVKTAADSAGALSEGINSVKGTMSEAGQSVGLISGMAQNVKDEARQMVAQAQDFFGKVTASGRGH